MNSSRLAKLAVAALRDVIRLDPAWRVAAWAELKFRHQTRQAFMRENGAAPAGPPATITRIVHEPVKLVPLSALFDEEERRLSRASAMRTLLKDLGVKPWTLPDLTDPEPPREGPMV